MGRPLSYQRYQSSETPINSATSSRRSPGVRVNLVQLFSRRFLRPNEDLGPSISPEALARNPPRFAVLTGASKPTKDFNSPVARASRVGLFV